MIRERHYSYYKRNYDPTEINLKRKLQKPKGTLTHDRAGSGGSLDTNLYCRVTTTESDAKMHPIIKEKRGISS